MAASNSSNWQDSVTCTNSREERPYDYIAGFKAVTKPMEETKNQPEPLGFVAGFGLLRLGSLSYFSDWIQNDLNKSWLVTTVYRMSWCSKMERCPELTVVFPWWGKPISFRVSKPLTFTWENDCSCNGSNISTFMTVAAFLWRWKVNLVFGAVAGWGLPGLGPPLFFNRSLFDWGNVMMAPTPFVSPTTTHSTVLVMPSTRSTVAWRGGYGRYYNATGSRCWHENIIQFLIGTEKGHQSVFLSGRSFHHFGWVGSLPKNNRWVTFLVLMGFCQAMDHSTRPSATRMTSRGPKCCQLTGRSMGCGCTWIVASPSLCGPKWAGSPSFGQKWEACESDFCFNIWCICGIDKFK